MNTADEHHNPTTEQGATMTDPTTPTTLAATSRQTTRRLVADEMCTDAVRAGIFGLLVELGAPVIREYRSDLYHDATWLRDHVTGPTEFQWVARPHGTHIGTDAVNAVLAARVWETGSVAYQITLTCEYGWRWMVTATELELVPAAA